MNNFDVHDAYKFLQGRKLFRVGYSNKQISELYNEIGFEEMHRLGIFNEAKLLLKKTYEISESGKLLCLETTTVRKN